MWQRFSERARRVVFFAQEEAGRLGENFVSTEHLLLGMVREYDSVAVRVLERLDVSLERIRDEIERQVAKGEGTLGQDMQLTPRAKRVIDLAYDEARTLGNNYIGSEHLLLGMIREDEGLAGRVLARLGVELERAREEVKKLQAETPRPEPVRPVAPTPSPSESWRSRPGDLGILKADAESEVVMAVRVAPELSESFFTTWNARDPYGWRELVERGAVVSLPAGTSVKFLKLVSGNLSLVRVLEGEQEGEALHIAWKSFEFCGEDATPWPPKSPVTGGNGL